MWKTLNTLTVSDFTLYNWNPICQTTERHCNRWEQTEEVGSSRSWTEQEPPWLISLWSFKLHSNEAPGHVAQLVPLRCLSQWHTHGTLCWTTPPFSRRCHSNLTIGSIKRPSLYRTTSQSYWTLAENSMECESCLHCYGNDKVPSNQIWEGIWHACSLNAALKSSHLLLCDQRVVLPRRLRGRRRRRLWVGLHWSSVLSPVSQRRKQPGPLQQAALHRAMCISSTFTLHVCLHSLSIGEPIIVLFVYLLLPPGVPPGLAVLGQQQLLIKHVHPLLPLDVQGGSHPQRALIARLRALNSSATDELIAKTRPRLKCVWLKRTSGYFLVTWKFTIKKSAAMT